MVESKRSPRPDAVELELFTQRFGAIAREMGELLQRTSISTNVKERLDFSCALLDPEGRLVVNAPHIPVHLGALGLCVRKVAAALPLGVGDVAITNHPAFGGSHLPDVTVVTPAFDAAGTLLGYAASRAHHAEIGGSRPGSMPPDARTLGEEGVAMVPSYLVRGSAAGPQPLWADIERTLTSGRFPSRAPAENLADLRAAVAANHRGVEALAELAARHGTATVLGRMDDLRIAARKQARRALARRPRGVFSAVQRLDDGSPLAVRIELPGDSSHLSDDAPAAIIDFAGTSPVHPGNLNAPAAVVRSAVLYVLRVLVDEPLPLNEGLLESVDLRVPHGSLLDPIFTPDPFTSPAVVGGNVETSQRVVDVLLEAFGLAAGSQGTMNNFLFGNEKFGYYETICGGAGAGPGFDGASAVHTHMTNTRITDPEILERRYPVRLERFAIRRGSGGAGQHRGGDGALREITFLAPMSISLLTQRRLERPYGLAGGEPAEAGRQTLHRANGESEILPPSAAREVQTGDRLVIETPGGGGWGTPRA